MAQDIINIGPQPNDGQGDNLRTAFDKTNDNFNQIWTAGPVGSNVRIAGNVISTLQVNQDLALSPNGVGNVRLNNNTIPGANNTWFLGSATMQWRGVYAASVETGNITITGTLTVPGDAVIQGNLTVEGDTIQIGNIVTDTKTIQLANTAANAIQANGSGITVGASDNIATFLYNSTSNSWVTNLQITYANGQPIGKTPGGSNTYIQFNDAGNFGGNANFTYNRATGNFYLGGANLRAVAGNSQPYILQVPGIAFQGGSAIMEWDAVNQHVDVSNSFSIAGTLQLYGNYPGTGALITTSGGSGVDIEIEPSGNLYLNADGGEVIVSDQTASVDPNTGALKVLGGIGVNGNINVGGNITGANITANYFVGNGSQLTGIVSSYGNANVANYLPTFSGNISAGNVSASGNISGAYVKGNGSELTNLPAPTVTQDISSTGAMSIMTYDGVIKYVNYATVEPSSGNITGGNISTTGNVTANYFVGLSGNITNLDSLNFTVENIGARVGNNGVNIGAGGYNNLVVLPTEVLIQNVPLTVAGNLVANQANGLYITANAPANGTAQIWNFGTDGRLTFPGTPRIDTDSNNFEVQAAENISLEANAVVNIYTDTSGNAYQWQFGDDGNLTLPTGKSIIVDGGDGAIGPVSDDMVISWDNEELILRSVAGSVQVEGDNDFNIQVDYNSGAGDYLSKWAFAQDNEIVNITGNSAIVTEAGNLNLQGGRNTINSGNVTITAINTGVAVNVWTFDNTGNLTVPGNIVMPPFSSLVGDGASPAPSISGFSSATFGANVTATGNITGGNIITTGNVSGNTAGFAIGYRDIPQVSFTGNATIVTTDAGKHFYSTQSTDYILTIANNASQGFATGAAITVVNQGTGNITVAQGSGVTLYLAGNATSGNRTVSTFGMATIMKVATDTWFINGTGVS